MRHPTLIVGAGLTGLTVARALHDAGKSVLVVEAADRPGGLVADAVHPSGIRYGLHGPHWFRCESDELWRWVHRFATWHPFAAEVLTCVGGRFYPWPLDADTLASCGPVGFAGDAHSFETACLSRMPRIAYERWVRPYNVKQWGLPPDALLPSLAGRIDQAVPGDRRLKAHKHQGLPEGGYSALVWNMLGSIPIEFGHRFRLGDERPGQRVIFTGPIDELFDYVHGALAYRSQRRRLEWLDYEPLLFPAPQINFPSPDDGPQIRLIEWKHMERIGNGALLTFEVPSDDGREYPVPTAENRDRYARYKAMLDEAPHVIAAGRLGRMVYMDMDVAIAAGLSLARRILRGAHD